MGKFFILSDDDNVKSTLELTLKELSLVDRYGLEIEKKGTAGNVVGPWNECFGLLYDFRSSTRIQHLINLIHSATPKPPIIIYAYKDDQVDLRLLRKICDLYFLKTSCELPKTLGEILEQIEKKGKNNKLKLHNRRVWVILKKMVVKFGIDISQAYLKANGCIFDPQESRSHYEHDFIKNLPSLTPWPENPGDTKKDFKDFMEKLYSRERVEHLYDYIEALKAFLDEGLWNTELKILIIDNNLRSFENPLKELLEIIPEYKFYLKKLEANKFEQYSKFKKDLEWKKDAEEQKDKIIDLLLLSNDGADSLKETKIKEIKIKNLDLILLDLDLGGGGVQLEGEELLELFNQYHPEIPCFIFSSINEFNTIRKTLQGGANGYITKQRMISLPDKIRSYYEEEIGKIVYGYINDDSLRRNLVGNLRYWKYKKDLIWFGDKCFHMINHTYQHAKNNWKIANQILPPIIDYINCLATQGDKNKSISGEDLYSLYMAIWLHDMGHKGNEQYGDAHEIRDLHGLISGELLLKYPKFYGIYGYSDNVIKSPYQWGTYRHPKTAPQMIRERMAVLDLANSLANDPSDLTSKDNIIRKATLLERIALISIYHKSNFPLDDGDIKRIQGKGKKIPNDCRENFDRETYPIHLQSICNFMDGANPNFIGIVTLFRFIDALDIRKNRVGDITEENIKKETIRRDLDQQLLKLKKEVEKLIHIGKIEKGKERRFFSLFYEQPVEGIRVRKGIDKELKKEQRAFLDLLPEEPPTENYTMLLEYIQYLSVQDLHFDLHNSIKEIEITCTERGKGRKPHFEIAFISDKTTDYLKSKDHSVREWWQAPDEGRSIAEYLLGSTDEEKKDNKGNKDKKKIPGYVRRELNDGKRYLKKWIDLENTSVKLKPSDGEPLKEYLEE